MKDLLRAACTPEIAMAALRVALVVGTALNLVNQGPLILHGGDVSWMQVVLNYLMPYCVSSYGGARVRLRQGRDR